MFGLLSVFATSKSALGGLGRWLGFPGSFVSSVHTPYAHMSLETRAVNPFKLAVSNSLTFPHLKLTPFSHDRIALHFSVLCTEPSLSIHSTFPYRTLNQAFLRGAIICTYPAPYAGSAYFILFYQPAHLSSVICPLGLILFQNRSVTYKN